MGERAKKKRAADAKAARKAKKAAEDPDPPSDNNLPSQSKTKTSKKKAAAPRVRVASVTSTRRSTRSHVVSSTVGSSKKNTSVAKNNNGSKLTGRERSATIAAKALLEQLKISEDEDTTDFDEDPQGDGEADDDNNDSTISGNDDDDSDGDGSEVEVVEDGTKQGLVVRAKATRKDTIEEESSESDEEETFEMTFEINDKARGARKNLTLSSLASWDNLQDRVAQVLNVHQGSLQLQYRFSNEKNNSLPFDLRSDDDYDEMRNQLRPFIVPKILASGKRSKSVRKLVVVQLFNRGMEGVSGGKGAKKSTKPPVDIDTPTNKHDEYFEKKKAVISQLTTHWRCETHSLPDKPALCWIPIEKRPHGECYPITQSNINFWASCIIRDPTVFSVTEKPTQLNFLNNVPRRHGSSANPTTQLQAPLPMPYGYYPPPHSYFPNFPNPMQWPGLGFPQPAGSQAHGAPQPIPTVPARQVRGPQISAWLQYCDRTPGRDGEDFSALIDKFRAQGYRTIDQLTGTRMSVENLSNWLEIGKGTADLIIQYAEEDMASVKSGNFMMGMEPGPDVGFE